METASFVEQNVLLAVMEDEPERARYMLRDFRDGELLDLYRNASALAELCNKERSRRFYREP